MNDQQGGLQVAVEQTRPMRLSGELHCSRGEVAALVGPSGAGKTSILRAIAGLMRPEHGRIAIGNEIWFDAALRHFVPARRRAVGLVFQDYALMPHLPAREDVALALLDLPRAERLARADGLLAQMGLTPEQAARRPAALSGGQRQRVAVARALAREPKVLLLDEPFSAIDPMSRQALYDLLADLRERLAIPIVMVTHDLSEARQLADTIIVLDRGQVLQQGTPERIHRSPRNARVADLLGIANRFRGRWLGPLGPQDTADGMAWIEWLGEEDRSSGIRLRVRDKRRIDPGQAVTWVIQSEGVLVGPEIEAPTLAAGGGCVTLEARIVSARHLGDMTSATLVPEALPGVILRIMRAGPARQALRQDARLTVRLACDWVHVMPIKDGGPPLHH